ncbi:MAG: prepilin-type N-terminal cleavage/methylation domain-containing protein [Thermovirgaceae bacterium]
MLRRVRQQKAFTLVEVLISLVILAIALLALAAVVMSTTMLLSHTIDSEEAVNVGVKKLDEIEGWDYADIDPSSADVTEGKYTLSWTVTTNTNDKDVDLTVEWDGIIGSKSVELKRTISELGN